MTVRILVGHVLDRLAELPAASVHCVVTSPPYWGLRDFKIPPQVWGGDPGCTHEWHDEGRLRRSGGINLSLARYGNGLNERTIGAQIRARSVDASCGSTCRHCSAWRGSLGLEPDYRLYVKHLVVVFRAVRRVVAAGRHAMAQHGRQLCDRDGQLVAARLGRDAILIELNSDYAEMAERRIRGDAGLFAAVETSG